MKNFTVLPNIQPLNFDELRNTVGGDGEVLSLEDLLAGNFITEDYFNL